MRAKFDPSNCSVNIVLGPTRRACFFKVPHANIPGVETGVAVTVFDSVGSTRSVSVATNEVNKTACRLTASVYTVGTDSPTRLSACVDADDPSMAEVRRILDGPRPEEKAKELLAAAYGNEVWPKEMRDLLKQWMQADDEDAKRNDSEVPLGVPDPEFDNAPATASLADSVNPLPSDRWPVEM